MSGLTAEGLVIETQEEIREGMNERARGEFGISIDVSDGAIEGQTFAIVSERIALCWEILEAIYSSTDPDAAVGARQDASAALTGTQRLGATSSTVVSTLLGSDATLIAALSRASVVGTEAEFETLEDITLALLTVWTPTTAFALDDRVSNGVNAYICIGAGTSAGSGGPVLIDPTDLAGETDGSVLWRFLGEGLAAGDGPTAAVLTGPTVATAGSITQIETPVSGWDSVTNLLDATVGTNIETNPALRVRREEELATPGTSPVDAIRADLLKIAGVTAVTVFENTSDITVDGIPPHAVEALIQGGADQAIWDVLRVSVAGGIETEGDEVGTSTDTQGNDFTMKFTRQTEVDIWVIIELTKDPDTYPLDGDDQVKNSIVSFGDAQKTGKDVVSSSVGAQAFNSAFAAGVLDVTATFIGTAPAPATEVTIPITLRDLALFDTSRITVTSINGVP